MMSDELDVDPITELFQECYPAQKNVIQATSRVQFWLVPNKNKE